MERCFKCGISSEKAALYDAISEKEIVKICEKCQARENLPVIKKAKTSANWEPEKRMTVRERLSYMKGINPKEVEKKTREEIERTKKQNEDLRKIIAKKYEEEMKVQGSSMQADVSGESGMIRNFHWAIMRTRRARHMTQRELADKIGEPEIAIKMAEQGILPREREFLVKKIQNALKIQITKIPYDTYAKLPPQESQNSDAKSPEESQNPEDYREELKLDSEKEKRWTIGDLLRIKKRVKVKERSISDALDDDSEELKEKIERTLEENKE